MIDVMIVISNLAGLGLLIAFVLFLSGFIIWLAFKFLDYQLKRLMKSLGVTDVYQFGCEYREWKKGKEQSNG